MKELTSTNSPLVKYWAALMRDASFRKLEQKVLLEGKNCIQDVCKTIKANRLIVIDTSLIPDGVVADEIVLVTESIMKKISSTKSPEGIIAELDMPKPKDFNNVSKIVVADRIQDPGNLGTLIRSSLAFGWDGLFILEGTVDPFNDKALRAAKGATFSLPICFGSWHKLTEILERNNLKLVAADIHGEKPSSFKSMRMALVLGNEAKGISIPQGICYRSISLPMTGSMESLNVAVAGSILLYLFQESS